MIEPERISINISQQAETYRLRVRIAGVDNICKKFSGDVGPMLQEDVKQLRRLATYFSPNLNGAQREEMADYPAFEKEMNLYCRRHGFDPWLENYDLTGHTEQPKKKSTDETVVVTYN